MKLVRITLAHISSHKSLIFRIYTLTWNTNAQYAPDDMNCQKLLGLEEMASSEIPDIFCLGYVVFFC